MINNRWIDLAMYDVGFVVGQIDGCVDEWKNIRIDGSYDHSHYLLSLS